MWGSQVNKNNLLDDAPNLSMQVPGAMGAAGDRPALLVLDMDVQSPWPVDDIWDDDAAPAEVSEPDRVQPRPAISVRQPAKPAPREAARLAILTLRHTG